MQGTMLTTSREQLGRFQRHQAQLLLSSTTHPETLGQGLSRCHIDGEHSVKCHTRQGLILGGDFLQVLGIYCLSTVNGGIIGCTFDP